MNCMSLRHLAKNSYDFTIYILQGGSTVLNYAFIGRWMVVINRNHSAYHPGDYSLCSFSSSYASMMDLHIPTGENLQVKNDPGPDLLNSVLEPCS